ncbi:MAG: metallophosphoesterase [Candidatus Sulfotelmatobacter sp.]
MARSWSLLSITDLHYESPDIFVDDNKDGAASSYLDQVFVNFNNILEKGFGDPPKKFDLIAVCGDITTQGKEKGLDRFERETIPLLHKLAPKREAICVVPGNHDVEWNLNPNDENSFDQKFKLFEEMVQSTNVTSCLYPVGEAGHSELQLQYPKNGPIFEDHQRKIFVACINSSMRCGEINSKMQTQIAVPLKIAIGTLHPEHQKLACETLTTLEKDLKKDYLVRDVAQVTQAQLKELRSIIDKKKKTITDWNSYLRVAVLHHHLVQFSGQATEQRGYALLLDSANMLETLLDYDFDLVLTGHKHQPYEFTYINGHKRLLLVGGPTVGGQSVRGTFRGFRKINVDDWGSERVYNIYDVPEEFGDGNPSMNIQRAHKIEPIKIRRSLRAAHEERVKEEGFSYQAMASITLLQDDGDATRVVENDYLKISQRESTRREQHDLRLPWTAGYLANFKVKGVAANPQFQVHVENDIPDPKKQHVKYWEPRVKFAGIPDESPVSYTYEWKALSAFAMDKDQFSHMYPHEQDNIEFTHFSTEDPVEELTVVVQFPPHFKPNGFPTLHVTTAKKEIDARGWDPADEARRELERGRALRYYDALKIAALRVMYPRPELSYGIQWEVPSPPPQDPNLLTQNAVLVAQLSALPDQLRRADRVKMLGRIISATRKSFLPKWQGAIHASLMYFDLKFALPLIVAGFQTDIESETQEVRYDRTLAYGEGIAGRAFKSNSLRVYVFDSNDPQGIDLYTQLPGGPEHMVMVSLPVHVPVPTSSFEGDPGIYQRMRPYGVINIGSELLDCPLSKLRLPEYIPRVMEFQHEMNRLIYQDLTGK